MLELPKGALTPCPSPSLWPGDRLIATTENTLQGVVQLSSFYCTSAALRSETAEQGFTLLPGSASEGLKAQKGSQYQFQQYIWRDTGKGKQPGLNSCLISEPKYTFFPYF